MRYYLTAIKKDGTEDYFDFDCPEELLFDTVQQFLAKGYERVRLEDEDMHRENIVTLRNLDMPSSSLSVLQRYELDRFGKLPHSD